MTSFPCCILWNVLHPSIYIHRVVSTFFGYYLMISGSSQGGCTERWLIGLVHTVVPRSTWRSPCSVVFKVMGDHSFFACVLFFITRVGMILHLPLPYCFLCFSCFYVFPFHLLFSAVTWFGLMEPEAEPQLMGAGAVASQLFIV